MALVDRLMRGFGRLEGEGQRAKKSARFEGSWQDCFDFLQIGRFQIADLRLLALRTGPDCGQGAKTISAPFVSHIHQRKHGH